MKDAIGRSRAQGPWAFWLWTANVVLLLAVAAWVIVQVVRSSTATLGVSGTAKEEHIQDLFWFALLCGLAAFATLELVKRLTRVRGLLQREAARRWFARRHDGADFERLLALLSLHAHGQDVRQLFDLPAEQTAAQISAAAETALLAQEEGLLPKSWLDASRLVTKARAKPPGPRPRTSFHARRRRFRRAPGERGRPASGSECAHVDRPVADRRR